MNRDARRAVTTFAVLAAIATCFAAVSLHAREVGAGYRLAAAQLESRRLARELRAAQQAVATARSPAVVRATALALALEVEYPRRSPEVRGGDVYFYRGAAAAEDSAVAKADAR